MLRQFIRIKRDRSHWPKKITTLSFEKILNGIFLLLMAVAGKWRAQEIWVNERRGASSDRYICMLNSGIDFVQELLCLSIMERNCIFLEVDDEK